MKTSTAFGALFVAFAAGVAAGHVSPAHAAVIPMTPQLIDVGGLGPEDLPTPAPGARYRTKTLVAQDGATVAVQIGVVAKHYHADTNEVQYVIDGSGTEWLGDKQVVLRPGIMVVIPKGTPHGGSTETSGHLKYLSIKTPPQGPDDQHPLP